MKSMKSILSAPLPSLMSFYNDEKHLSRGGWSERRARIAAGRLKIIIAALDIRISVSYKDVYHTSSYDHGWTSV
jgi:hypothetical protein